MSSDNQPSTIKSYVDSAVAGVQSTIGNITGNTVDKQQAEDRHAHAEAERDLSKAGAKIGMSLPPGFPLLSLEDYLADNMPSRPRQSLYRWCYHRQPRPPRWTVRPDCRFH